MQFQSVTSGCDGPSELVIIILGIRIRSVEPRAVN